LQRRNKWQTAQAEVKVGDIVLVKDINLFHRTWPLGRITKILPGSNRHTTAVEVKTLTGVYSRPVTKLVPQLLESHELTHGDTSSPKGGGCSGYYKVTDTSLVGMGEEHQHEEAESLTVARAERKQADK